MEIASEILLMAASTLANMCPRADAGEDQVLSTGCNFIGTLDGSDSEDPQGEEITFLWTSLDGYDENFISPTSSTTDFEFPITDSDMIFSFVLFISSKYIECDGIKNYHYSLFKKVS